MAIANKNDLSHIVRTTQQWTTSYDSYECIPEGVLCVEFTPDGHVKAKIGNGHDIFSKLPYIGGADLTNYYTKSETAQCVEEIIKANRFIRIKGILQNKDQLPSHADCGDLYFVISQNQSSSNKYDEYVYSPSNTWENLGSIPIDIDLSEYAKIVYVDEKIDEVNERIDDIEQHGTHTHANKDILDLITAAFTAEEKDKLSTLYNYDDTELRELITQASHTHSNKDILDAISAPFTKEDKSKLDQLNPYDDSILKEKIQALERLAHEHSNKRILDRTTASFTTEYERKMRWIRLYTGCTGMEEGIAGLVPAAQAGEEDYVLSGSGEWVPQTGGGGTYELPIATTSTLGGIKVGDGLEIDANGKLSVVGGGGGGDSIAEGDGITITTDPQTGVKTISVNTGDHLSVDSQTGELNVTGVDYEAGQGIRIGSNYNFLEYIKNSGNYDQIILTDILPKYDDKLVIDMQFGIGTGLTNNTGFYGVRENNTSVYCTSMWVDSRDTWNTISTYNHFDYEQGQQSHVFSVSSTAKHHGNNPRQLFTVHQNIATWGNDTINFADQYDSSLSDPTLPFAIFGRNMNGVLNPFYTFELFVYNVKLYDSNNVLIHDLRPVERVSDNAAGLYDVLTNKFYGNAGGGSFVKGPVVTTPDRIINAKIGNGLHFDSNNAIEVNTGNGLSINQDNELEVNLGSGLQFDSNGAIEVTNAGGVDFEPGDGLEMVQEGYFDQLPLETYSHCDYVENANDARCQLDYLLPQNVRVTGKFSPVQALTDGPVFGSRTNSNASGHQFVLWCSVQSTNVTPYKIGFVSPGNQWGTATEANGGTTTTFVQNDIINFDIDFPNSQVLINDEYFQPINVSSSQTATVKPGIFSCAKSDTPTWEYKFCGKIYGMKFYVGNAMVVNLVPAVRDSDNVVGFYDNVNDVFYTSITSTAFSTDISTITKDEPSTQTVNVLNVIPATSGNIGGVIPRRALTVDLKGRLDVDLATSTTPGIITPKEGLNVDANGELTVTKATSSTMGGLKIGSGIIQAPDGTVNVSAMEPFDIGDGLELEYDSEDALPTGYAYVDYISSNPSTATASSGQARTVIDYVPNANTRYKVRGSRNNNHSSASRNFFCGARQSSYDYQSCLLFLNSGTNKSDVGFLYGSALWADIKYNMDYVPGDIVVIEADANSLKVDGTTVATYTPAGNIPSFKIGVFGATVNGNTTPGWTDNYPMNGKIYYLKIYEGDTLVVNLIPAYRYADDTVGFYDNINDKFYTSITSYPFTTDMTTLNPDPANRKLNVVPATANTLGGIKVGSGLSIESDGTLSVVGGSGGGNYSAGDAIEIDTSLFNVDAIRWDISDIKDPIQTFSANGPWVQARYIQFRDNSNNVILIDSGSGVWSDDTAVSYYQDLTLANMIANTQKMCASWRSPDLTMKLTFLLDSPVNVSNIAKFRILLGDDEPCRDPKAWSIYVRNAITQEWYLVHSTVDAQLSNTRNVWTDDFLLENPNRSTINVKYGNGLTLNASNELEVDLPVASDSTLGGVIVGDGILVDNDGTISVDPTIIPEVTEYEAGTAISIEDAEHGGVTFDAWDSGTGWENVCYRNSTGNAVVTYTYEAHSPISNSYTLPAGATHIRAIAYDQNDTMLWTSFSWIDANNYHFASTSPEDGHYNDWFDIPEGAVKVNFGVRHSKLNTSQSMNLNDIKSVDITIQTISEIEVDVWTGVTGWTNGDYYSGTSDTFTRDWYYTYHYDPTAYIPVPEGALKIRVIGISNENDSHFEGGGANIFDSNHHHIGWLPCCTATGEWVDIPEGTVYVQPEVKWSNGNTRTISAADIKSVTLAWKLPALEINQAINVKYGDGLTVNQNNELEVNIGTGLEIDPQTGAINVTGGGSGGGNSGNYIEGEAIEFEEGASRLPTGYTELENISNVSASYIDTGYIPNTDTQLSIIANIHRGTTSWQTLFGARDAVNPGGTEYAFFVRLNDNYNFYPRITGDQYTYMPNQTYDEKIRIDINNTTATVTRQDGSSYSYTQTGSLSNLSTTLAIFALHNQTGYVDNGIIDLYSFKIYENNTIVKDFVPCKRNSDDAIGLIDIINNVFYTNLGTGTFTAGRILTNTSINVKYGTGLSVDPVTNELFVDGQLPEGTIIKKLTYTGNGASTNNIQFDKKPLAILSLNGSSGQNYGSLIPTFIDSPYLHGVFGGSTNSGTTFRSSMSYDDSTNTLSLTNTSDEGLAFNIANKPYVMYYLTKGHTGSGTSVNNEVSVIKTITYTGTGTATNNIQFPETPDMLLSIYGPTSDGFIASSSVPITSTSIAGIYEYGSASRYGGVVSCGMSFNDSTNILTLSGGVDDGARFNISGATYIVTYSVNEVIPSTMPYDAGEAISIETIGGLQPTNYSNDDFVDSIVSMNAGSIVKAADKSSFTITASMNDCYTRGSSGQANGSYPFNVKASTKYRFAWDSADPTVHGKVYTYENGLYDAMMHEIDQYDSPYLEFTTSPNTTFIQARFGVMYAGDSITYSNVRLYEVIEDEDQYNEISVKHGDGLIVNERNELEVNIGTGLAFDPQTGAINVTGGGGSGDTVAQGAGIDITTDQQTGNKVIAVNAGTGLQVDQTTNELEIDDSVVTEDDELNLVFVPDDYQPS